MRCTDERRSQHRRWALFISLLVAVGKQVDRGAIQTGQRGVGEKFLRFTVEDKPTVQAGELRDGGAHHRNIVSHKDEGDRARAVQCLEELIEVLLGLRVDSAGGLVQQEQLRSGDQRSSNQGALLLSYREAPHELVLVMSHPDEAECLVHRTGRVAARGSEEAGSSRQAGGDHLGHGGREAGIQGHALGNVAQARPLSECVYGLTEQGHRPRRQGLEPKDHSEQRRLSRSIGADDPEEVSLLDPEVDPVKDHLAIALQRDVCQLHQRAHVFTESLDLARGCPSERLMASRVALRSAGWGGARRPGSADLWSDPRHTP